MTSKQGSGNLNRHMKDVVSAWNLGSAVVRVSTSSFTSNISFLLRAYVKRVNQYSTDSRWFSPGAAVPLSDWVRMSKIRRFSPRAPVSSHGVG